MTTETEAIVVGAGPAGLALSRELSLRGVDHCLLERGRVGERWRSERWDSLRLLSIAEQSALPGLDHGDCDPESFIPAAAFADYLTRYASTFAVPVVEHCAVTSVELHDGGYRVVGGGRAWNARAVIVAAGACDVPYVPPCATLLPSRVRQIVPNDYRSPADLPPGGMLVVGGSSTGLQIAEEVHASGRPVTLSVGEHTRMVRRYRGRDVLSWAGDAGILDDPADGARNVEAARRQPSLQLVGREDHRNLDLANMRKLGIRLAGRLTAINGDIICFDDQLAQRAEASHARMLRVIERIDRYIDDNGLKAVPPDVGDLAPFDLGSTPVAIDLEADGIASVVWATGYRRDYSWLKAPVLDAAGEVRQVGGVTELPGLYIIGLTFLRRRRSNFIDGCGVDAAEIAQLVHQQLTQPIQMRPHRSAELDQCAAASSGASF